MFVRAGRKRKMEEDSGMQSVLESALADVTAPKSAVLTMQTIENDDADPTDVTTVEITSSSSSGAPLPAAVVSRELSALPAAKHMRCTPVTPPTLCVNPLGVKMNLPRMHEEAAAEVVTYEAGDLTFMAKVGFPVPKAVSSIRPGQCVYVKTDSGTMADGRLMSLSDQFISNCWINWLIYSSIDWLVEWLIHWLTDECVSIRFLSPHTQEQQPFLAP